MPESELVEKDKEFEPRIATAGFKPKEIEVTTLPDAIVVGANQLASLLAKQFYRRFVLPVPIDVSNTAALKVTGPQILDAKASVSRPVFCLLWTAGTGRPAVERRGGLVWGGLFSPGTHGG